MKSLITCIVEYICWVRGRRLGNRRTLSSSFGCREDSHSFIDVRNLLLGLIEEVILWLTFEALLIPSAVVNDVGTSRVQVVNFSEPIPQVLVTSALSKVPQSRCRTSWSLRIWPSSSRLHPQPYRHLHPHQGLLSRACLVWCGWRPVRVHSDPPKFPSHRVPFRYGGTHSPQSLAALSPRSFEPRDLDPKCSHRAQRPPNLLGCAHPTVHSSQ